MPRVGSPLHRSSLIAPSRAARVLVFVALAATPACTAPASSAGAPDLAAASSPPDAQLAADWHFTDVTAAAGFHYTHQYTPTPTTGMRAYAALQLEFAGGVASGDFDGDGRPDLYITRGDLGPNLLFHNRGDGTFADVAAAAGVAIDAARGSGPAFADVDGDGLLDLVIGGVEDTTMRLFRNRGDGTFADITAGSGLEAEKIVMSATFGDYDLDGDLDLAIGRWGGAAGLEHLWANDGHGRFTPVGQKLGVAGFGRAHLSDGDFSFTPNFADINDDGRPDLLFSGDYLSTQYFINRPGGGFTVLHPLTLNDSNGMGGAVADFDNDGRLDWFVTSIDDVDEGPTMNGNRLYHNAGGGNFEEVSARAGVRPGFWAWGACFADFNNDGVLDIFHTNGFRGTGMLPDGGEFKFNRDPSRLFVGNGDGTFTERSAALGLVDTGQGRGIVCFDYDGDGDIDVFVANNGQPPSLWRNDLAGPNHFLDVKLAGQPPNTEGIGARVYATTGPTTQMRELRAGCNYASQDPAVAHFGLGAAARVSTLRVVWPDRTETLLSDVPADTKQVIRHP